MATMRRTSFRQRALNACASNGWNKFFLELLYLYSVSAAVSAACSLVHRLTGLGRLVVLWGICEVVFFLYQRWRYHQLSAASFKEYPSTEPERIFTEFLSLKGSICAKSHFRGWFHGVPFNKIYRENAKDFAAYAFFYKHRNTMTLKEAALLESFTRRMEEEFDLKFAPGFNPDLNCLFHLWEPLRVIHFPLIWHAFSLCLGLFTRWHMWRQGYHFHTMGTLGFWLRDPQHPGHTCSIAATIHRTHSWVDLRASVDRYHLQPRVQALLQRVAKWRPAAPFALLASNVFSVMWDSCCDILSQISSTVTHYDLYLPNIRDVNLPSLQVLLSAPGWDNPLLTPLRHMPSLNNLGQLIPPAPWDTSLLDPLRSMSSLSEFLPAAPAWDHPFLEQLRRVPSIQHLQAFLPANAPAMPWGGSAAWNNTYWDRLRQAVTEYLDDLDRQENENNGLLQDGSIPPPLVDDPNPPGTPTGCRTRSCNSPRQCSGTHDPTHPPSTNPTPFRHPPVCPQSPSMSTHTHLPYTSPTSPPPIPIVFIHGVGLGALPYLHFISQLKALCPNHPFMVLEAQHVALRLCRDVPTFDDLAQATVEMLRAHGYRKAVFIGHSFGTFAIARICQMYPDAVHSVMLMDPVCLLLCYPKVLYNFVYRKPNLLGLFSSPLRTIIDVGRWFFARDMLIAATMCRNFWWHELVLWQHHLPKGSVVAVAGKDHLVPSKEISLYLNNCPNVTVLFSPNDHHGTFLLHRKWCKRILEHVPLAIAQDTVDGGVSSSPTSGDRQYSPTSSDRQYSPTSSDRQYSPTSVDSQCGPTSVDKQYSPVSAEGSCSPTAGEGQYSPSSTQGSSCSLSAEGSCGPTVVAASCNVAA